MLTTLILNFFRKSTKCWQHWFWNPFKKVKDVDYIHSWWWLHWLWLMTRLIVIVQPTSTSIPPWAWPGTSRPLKLPIKSLATHLWPMARFRSIFLHFPLILVKSIVTTLITQIRDVLRVDTFGQPWNYLLSNNI
jgi:hypothetical protein